MLSNVRKILVQGAVYKGTFYCSDFVTYKSGTRTRKSWENGATVGEDGRPAYTASSLFFYFHVVHIHCLLMHLFLFSSRYCSRRFCCRPNCDFRSPRIVYHQSQPSLGFRLFFSASI